MTFVRCAGCAGPHGRCGPSRWRSLRPAWRCWPGTGRSRCRLAFRHPRVQRRVCGLFRRRGRPADLAPPWPPGQLDLGRGRTGERGELRHHRVRASGIGRPPLSPRRPVRGWVQQWIWVPLIALITVYLFLLFPRRAPALAAVVAGRLAGRRLRDHRDRPAGVLAWPGPAQPAGAAQPARDDPGGGAVRCGHGRADRAAGLARCSPRGRWRCAVGGAQRYSGTRSSGWPAPAAWWPWPWCPRSPVADPRDPGPDRCGRGIRRRAGGAGRGRRAEVPAL